MTTRLKLACDGCSATIETSYFKRTFHSVSGKSWGFGHWETTSIDDLVAPTGWQWCDPITGCTYCPKCWAEIIGEDAAQREKSNA